MTVQCVTCQHFSLRDAGRMAAHGFGNCASRARHVFLSATFERECKTHVGLDADSINKRLAWLGEPVVAADKKVAA